jgi:beta-lactamase superfamily II metal-dependent hydrolase
MYNIHLLPASFGDSILIEYGKTKPKYILIDGGPYFAFKDIIPALKNVAPDIKEIELLVITHIDIDHIDGTITLLNQDELPFTIKEVWFNGWNEINSVKDENEDDVLGALQGEYLSSLIQSKGIPHNTSFDGNAIVVTDPQDPPVITLDGGMKLTLLSPTIKGLQELIPVWKKEIEEIESESTIAERWKNEKRYDDEIDDLLGLDIAKMQKAVFDGDKSAANRSSIAFIASHDGKHCLFAGDATTEYLLQAIEPMLSPAKKRLKLNAWKLAHHGSKKSTLDTLMQKIDCKTLLISSDGKRYKHPDKECIAKLIGNNGPNVKFHFNYSSSFNKPWSDTDLQKEHKFKAFYPKEGEAGISVSL